MVDELNQSTLSTYEREELDRLMLRISRNAGAINQALELVENLAESGTLAALNATFEDFDENFSALTRPDLMGMVANLMMLLGTLSQMDYEPFFKTAMRTPAAMNEAYPAFQARTEPMGMREMMAMIRTPEFAGAMQTMMAVMRSQRNIN